MSLVKNVRTISDQVLKQFAYFNFTTFSNYIKRRIIILCDKPKGKLNSVIVEWIYYHVYCYLIIA